MNTSRSGKSPRSAVKRRAELCQLRLNAGGRAMNVGTSGVSMKQYPQVINLTKPSKKKGDTGSDRRKKQTKRLEHKSVSKSTNRRKAGVELPASSYKVIWIPIDTIKVDIANRRPIIPGVVKTLVAGIPEDGLRTPITVRLRNGVAHLIAGFQRLEALKILGWDEAPCVTIRGRGPAQRWQIVENAHRGELTKLQRANQTAALLALSSESPEGISGEKVQKKKRGRPESGDAKAARALPVRGKTPDAKRKHIAEDRKISGIHQDAQRALFDAGLDDNGKALREVADEPTREAQITKVWALAKGSGKTSPSPSGDDAEDAAPPLVVLKRAWKKAKKLRVAWQNAALEDRRAFIIEDLGYPLDEEPEDDEDDDEADD
jgi:ParB-like chromosome segregation protein Spo0J